MKLAHLVGQERTQTIRRKENPMRLTILALILTTLAIPTAAQQTQPTTSLGATFSAGTESGLGYALPYIAFGGALEHSISSHIEAQASADYSPTHKVITHDGHQSHLGGRALVWLGSRFALTAADREGWLSTSQFRKSANSPAFGVAGRLWWLGTPSRIYAAYLPPMGRRPTDGSLQSNRTQGISTTIESQGYSRVRLTTTFDVLTFLDQSGAAPGLRHWEGTLVVTARFGTRQNLADLY
jgi:hypothetical protein